ncbi:M13 family metallopeptidase [Leekyejoonella antrihumi]|uniref:Peptidase M13 n=1 Tax=Leekyejoonella antrihumi TaxID=1660198 RepID=A0A563DTD5_9MICO|nr:M13-type metalloendopeptidase [Leekyejoonella antrihumi]TWP33510.1 peptidase M13 [Leekyejoonella antrihumi]
MKSGITATFDESVRPQDDLFGYVNNVWVKESKIPEDRARYGSFDRLREEAESSVRAIVEDAAASVSPKGSPSRKVGDLYASFMDTAKIEALGAAPLAADLRSIRAVLELSSLVKEMGRLTRLGVPCAVAPYVTADAKDTEQYIVYVEQEGLGLPNESYYREDKYAEIRDQYVAHIERMLSLAGVRDAAELAPQVMEVDTRIASAHWNVVATRDAVKTYNKFEFAALSDLAPHFDWTAWAHGLNAPHGGLDHVVVREPSFLQGLSDALRDLPMASWKAWLSWRLVSAQAPYLHAALVDESFDFNGRVLSGTPQLKERWKRGVELVEGALGEAAGELYVAQHFPPRAKERMAELVANLVEAYRRDFQTLEWMSAETRARALDKLAKFTPKIGYPDKWRDYGTLEIDADDLVGNVERAARFEMTRELAKVGEPIDRTEWLITPQTVNAYYHPMMNEIVFPAAILQPPFFDVDADDAVNYGGIGAVIGHEIGHGFDDQGSRYDGDGTLTDWWTQEDRERFDERAKALVAQFDALEPADAPGHSVNGGLTVGENIGDLGGLTIGHMAFQIASQQHPSPVLDGFTGEQRFFLGWAQVWCGKAREAEAVRLLAIDPHAPMDCRANVARNLREYHEAFDVEAGDGMYLSPQEQVRIF